MDPALLDELEPRIDWVRLPGGEFLFRPGDPGDAAYIVLARRLRVIGPARGRREASVEEIGRGQPIGMTSLLTGRPRSWTVVAIRDTDLARIPSTTLRWFIEGHPAASVPIMAELADRLERAAIAPLGASDRAATFALIVRPGVDAAEFGARLSAAIGTHGRTLVLTSSDVASIAQYGVATPLDTGSDASWMPLHHWLEEREAAHDFVIYVSDPTLTPWTDQCIRQADHVVIVADATGDSMPTDVERQLDGRWPESAAPRRTLILLQPGDLDEPHGTARWLEARSVDQHLHVRRGASDDLARVGRLLAGRGITLVLGGGGARGYAHIGVVRALEETGVPIDMVGGTSMGALIGAGVARGWSAAQLEAQFRKSTRRLFDPTPPIVSLLSGRRIWRAIDDSHHGIGIEDLWLPFFCVSTNLTRAAPVIHRSGSPSRAIRASASLPGILPPVYSDGSLLVDGGLLDTLPIGVMRRLNGGGRVVAVDVAPPIDMVARQDVGDHLSGWRMLREWFRRPRSRSGIPGIIELLSRTVAVPGLFLERHLATESADLLLQPPVQRWGTLDFKRVHPIAEAGYESAIGPVREWWSTEQAATASSQRNASDPVRDSAL